MSLFICNSPRDYQVIYILHVHFSDFMMLFDHIVGTVSFTQLAYTVYENNGTLQPELILSNPLSVNVTVEIDTVEGEITPGR